MTANLHDKPLWNEAMSYRNKQYRFLQHQQNTIGTLLVKVVEGENLLNDSPYVVCTLGKSSKSTSVAQDSSNSVTKWKRETTLVRLNKGDFFDGEKVSLSLRVMQSRNVGTRLLSGDDLIGVAEIEVTDLLMGDNSLIDTWVSLTGAAAKLRVSVQYEPNGEPPKKGDVVCFEMFARSENSLIFGNGMLAPMMVADQKGCFLLVQYRTFTGGYCGRIKIHRNTCFVIERLNVADGLWDMMLKPADAILSTTLGKKGQKLAQPTIDYATNMAKPVYYSSGLIVKATKTSVKASLKGVEHGLKVAMNKREEEGFE
ncbi:hypothetical protein ScalyP_jg4755 [Parmales sp. scaly parma]|nr:hypothetical protein ScalyP_jg4755 [Parmales sp. scaly parma]